MRGRHALAAASGVLCLLVSGCGGSADPKPLPKPTASTSASESASPPLMPAAAKVRSKDGAVAFARHYIDLINHAQATGDVAPLTSNETNACTSCGRANSVIDNLYRKGGSIKGGEFVVDSVDALKLPGKQAYLVEVGLHFGPQHIDWPEPKQDQDLAGGKGPMNVDVAWDGSAWKVERWTRGA